MDKISALINRGLQPEIRTKGLARTARHSSLALPGSQMEPSALADALDAFRPLPPEALFLGVAGDGLPVLLDMHEPSAGAILVVADPGAGKTSFLHSLACAAEILHTSREVQFGVCTPVPGEWDGFAHFPTCVDILRTSQKEAISFLDSLVAWVTGRHSRVQAVLLLLDGLEAVAELPAHARQLLYWLLRHGPVNLVWPIVTIDAEKLVQVQGWLPLFRTHIFGPTSGGPSLLGYPQDVRAFDTLQAEGGYMLREGGHWLKFHAPDIPA